jgi:hypothetical protein
MWPEGKNINTGFLLEGVIRRVYERKSEHRFDSMS